MAAVASPQSDTLSAALDAGNYLQSRLKQMTTASTSFSSIPIIDLSPSFSSSLPARQEVARKIHEACTTIGFFYITGHGMEATCDKTLKLAERFFHELPQEAKEAIHMRQSKYFRGYEPASHTSVNNFTSKETKEAFNWGYEAGLDPIGGDGKYVELDGSKDGGKNLWPDARLLPGFYEGIAEYYGQNPKALYALNEDEEIGLGAHTDYECFTLLLQDSNPGLEILSPDGHWISASTVEGGIVVNVADFLMRWTNGVYKSTIHRVINRTDKERFSVPLFFSINYDETVETLPSCVSEENPSKYPPITAGRYVLDRLSLTVNGGY